MIEYNSHNIIYLYMAYIGYLIISGHIISVVSTRYSSIFNNNTARFSEWCV